MKRLRKLASLGLALALTATIAPLTVSAASNEYSVYVNGTSVSFIQNGYTIGSFTAKSSSYTLMTDKSGDTMFCFDNSEDRYIGVTIGGQNSLTIGGKLTTLTLDKSLAASTVLGSNASVTNVNVRSGGSLTNYGNVSNLKVSSNAKVYAGSGSTISVTDLTSSSARLTAYSGSNVKSVNAVNRGSVSGSVGSLKVGGRTTSSSDRGDYNTSSDGRLHYSVSKLYADYDDYLDDMEDDLNDELRVYNSNNRRINGDARFTGSGRVRDDDYYSFRFYPDSSSYDTLSGRVRIVVDDDYDDDDDDDGDESIDLEYDDEITVSDSKEQLRDITASMMDLKAYNEDDKKVSGKIDWDDGKNKYIRDGETYDFTFKPSSSRYDDEDGSVTIFFK